MLFSAEQNEVWLLVLPGGTLQAEEKAPGTGTSSRGTPVARSAQKGRPGSDKKQIRGGLGSRAPKAASSRTLSSALEQEPYLPQASLTPSVVTAATSPHLPRALFSPAPTDTHAPTRAPVCPQALRPWALVTAVGGATFEPV